MTINVYIDSCAWNYLFENAVDLSRELPSSKFAIHITREVEIELAAIPDEGVDGSDKRSLKRYIQRSINVLPVKTSYVFGFQTLEPDGSPSPIQVYGGFDVGVFQSKEERDFYEEPMVAQQLTNRKKANSGLGKNEADASLAAKSFSSVVLTNERKDKNGPLKLAAEFGGRVVYLTNEVKPSGLSIGEYILSLG
jgi:hypothetical protein